MKGSITISFDAISTLKNRSDEIIELSGRLESESASGALKDTGSALQTISL
jgi:hypothetical protein